MPTSVALAAAFILAVLWVVLEHRNRRQPSIFDWENPEAMTPAEREWRIG